MPRDGSFHYTVPVGTDGIADQTIDSGRYNAFVHDVETDLNAPRPISAGGTGSSSAAGALANINGEMARQNVDNYDTFPFVSGSFYSAASATGSPVAGHVFIGICYTYADPSFMIIEARDLSMATLPTPLYVRYKSSSTWGPWTLDNQDTVDLANTKVARSGDVMSGNLTIHKVNPELFLNKTTSGETTQLWGSMNGLPRWTLAIGDNTAEGGGNVGSDFTISRWSDSGTFLGAPLKITRADGHILSNGYTPTVGAELTNKNYVDTQITSQITAKVNRAGDTMTGDLTISKANPSLNLDKTASGQTISIWSRLNGSNRWTLQLGDATAESGGNAGSDCVLHRWNDAAGYLGAALSITRAAGNVTIGSGTTSTGVGNGALVVAGGVGVGGAVNIGSSTASTGPTTGALTVVGGIGVGGAVNIGSSTASTSPTTGALVVAGGVGVGGAINIAGNVLVQSGIIYNLAPAAGDAAYLLRDETGSAKGSVTWLRTDNSIRLSNSAAAIDIVLESLGRVLAGKGTAGRSGVAGAYDSNNHNFFWNGANQMWIDNTNMGAVAVSCDYRTKKDITPLDSTWEVVKRLRPIVYTQREYTPPGATQPLFTNDDTWRWGFVAHELQETLLPSAAHGYKDSPTDIQSPNLLAIVAALTKALQEVMTRIEVLEGRTTSE